jgi:hypothetical protein
MFRTLHNWHLYHTYYSDLNINLHASWHVFITYKYGGKKFNGLRTFWFKTEFLALINHQKHCLRWLAGGYMCVCVCVCARARACVRAHACPVPFLHFLVMSKKLNINTCNMSVLNMLCDILQYLIICSLQFSPQSLSLVLMIMQVHVLIY